MGDLCRCYAVQRIRIKELKRSWGGGRMRIGATASRIWCARTALNIRQRLAALGLLILWIGCTVRPTLGQAVYGSIIGTVTDSSGAAVRSATITVTDLTKGTSVTTTTNDSGEYSVLHLIPDTYSVRAEAPGFEKATVDSVLVYADTAPKIDIQMTVGAVSTAVTVSAPSKTFPT